MASALPPSPDQRVVDYLDDRFQTASDLSTLPDVLASVETQRAQLQSQLDEAVLELDSARREEQIRSDALDVRIGELAALERSIDVRRTAVLATATAATDDDDKPSIPDANAALARLEDPVRRLGRLDLALGYVRLLRDVAAWQAEAHEHISEAKKKNKTTAMAALASYSRLLSLAKRLPALRGAVDDAAPHLAAHADAAARNVGDALRAALVGELEEALRRRGWPEAVDPSEGGSSTSEGDWKEAFARLVDFQKVEMGDDEVGGKKPRTTRGGYSDPGRDTPQKARSTTTLLAMDVLARNFVLEFRFHFMTDRPTSSPDAMGTHCLPWVLSLVGKWEGFLRRTLGGVLATKFVDGPLARSTAFVDPASAFFASLLPVLRDKVDSVAAQHARRPGLLSALVVRLVRFDDAVRVRIGYDGGEADEGWEGLTSELLEDKFDAWLKAEKDFAADRFQAILRSPDARNIDYESTGPGKMKATYAAVRVTDLLKSVTEKYRGLRRLAYRLRFLFEIQIDILGEYHHLLRGSLEAYYSVTSPLGRTLHGITPQQQAALEGTGALETLCKVLGSADHVVRCLRDWGMDEVSRRLTVSGRVEAADGEG